MFAIITAWAKRASCPHPCGQNPVHLDDYSEPLPDLALLGFSADYHAGAHPRSAEILLLIKVSDSTLDHDREEKLPAYGHAGIPEVWIINQIDATIEIHRDPRSTGYSSKTVLCVPVIKPPRWHFRIYSWRLRNY